MKREMYFVEFTDGTSPFFTQNAVSFKDMIIQLADYTATNCPLFIKALHGVEEERDMVAMYNMFSSWTVERILKVERISYDRSVSE